MTDEIIDDKALVKRWGITMRTLQAWRKQGRDLPVPFQESPRRYRLDHVRAFEDARAAKEGSK